MLVKTFGSAVYGIHATTITIEVNLETGVKFFLVGLPDNAVKESYLRVMAAVKNIGFRFPGKRITVNMAPADIRKEGSAYDLPIAIGILAGSEQVNEEKISKYIIMGELSLDGGLQPIKGALPIALQAKKEGFEGIILPVQNAREAAIVEEFKVIGASSLLDVIKFLNNEEDITPTFVNAKEEFYSKLKDSEYDLIQILKRNNIQIKKDETTIPLQEEISRIKALIFF